MSKNILCDSEYYRNNTDLVAQGAMALPAGVPAAGQGEPLPGVTRPPPREGDVVGGELGRVAWHVSGYTCPGYTRVAQIKKVIALMAYFLLSDH